MKSGIETEPAAYRFFRLLVHNLYEVLARNKVAVLFQKCKAWIIEGTVPGAGGGQTTRILVTEGGGQRAYISRLFFGTDFKCRYIGRHRLWQLVSPNSGWAKDCDAVVVGSTHRLDGIHPFKAAFCIPCWIDGCVDLRQNPEEFFRHSRNGKYNLKRILNADFQVSFTNDLDGFNHFYHKMYRPYILNVYNDTAQIQAYDSLKKRFLQSGELLILKDNSQAIAGMLMLFRNEIAIAHKLGVLDGNIRTARSGATSALYYYGMQRAHALGYTKLRLGGSRPFLSDGVLNFKLNCCDMQVDHYSSDAYFFMKFMRMSAGVRCFLMNNPFVCVDHDGMTVASFTPDLEDRRNVKRLQKIGSHCKIARQKIYAIGVDAQQDACHFPSGSNCIRITDDPHPISAI